MKMLLRLLPHSARRAYWKRHQCPENVRDAVKRGLHPRQPVGEVCSKGHPKSGDNLSVVVGNGRTHHRCRKCENERSARRQREARQARGLLKTQVSGEERARILALRESGMSQRRIAREVGRSRMAVQGVLKAAS